MATTICFLDHHICRLFFAQESFEHVEEWLMEVNRHASSNTIKLLVGNKADLVSQKAVTEEAAQVKFLTKFDSWFLCSQCPRVDDIHCG